MKKVDLFAYSLTYLRVGLQVRGNGTLYKYLNEEIYTSCISLIQWIEALLGEIYSDLLVVAMSSSILLTVTYPFWLGIRLAVVDAALQVMAAALQPKDKYSNYWSDVREQKKF